MRSFWRVLLVWLTVLAIPVQGVAAARMTHCLAAPASVQQHGSHALHESPVSPGRQDAHPRHHQHHPQGHHAHHAVTGDAHAVPHAHPVKTSAMATTAATADTEWLTDGSTVPETPASPQDGKATGVDKKCSACAACCAAAALPTHVAEVPMLDLASTPTCLTEVDSVSFIASGPERPPRTHLA